MQTLGQCFTVANGSPLYQKLFFKLENLNVIRKKVFEEEINVVILLQMQFPLEQIKINMSVLYIFFYFYILNIYYISGTSTKEIWHCLCKKTHTQKKTLYVKIQRELQWAAHIFYWHNLQKQKEKKRKKLSTLSQQRALCLFTPASLCWKHGPVWVHCTQVGMLVHFPRIFSHSWRISTG